MLLVGLVSAFNKGLSGGGFGPVVAGGLVIVGQEAKAAIATTTAAEVPVCIAGFLTYAIGATLSAKGGACQGGALSCFFSRATRPTPLNPWDTPRPFCAGGVWGRVVLLGPHPSLPGLRGAWLRLLVRPVHRYCAAVRLLRLVHARISAFRLLAPAC